MLSDDEGYVWIAAGDVAGHGYSCAIAQAMTKAALASLVGKRRTPAEVLQRADRVLRAAGFTRNFTSLALLRLRPETGEALLGNAGHPYPLLVAGGAVTELEIIPSSLPLGLGPPRHLRRPPAPSAPRRRPRVLLGRPVRGHRRRRPGLRLRPPARAAAATPAPSRPTGSWRRCSPTGGATCGGAQPLDDTTFVVLKRRAGGGAGDAAATRAPAGRLLLAVAGGLLALAFGVALALAVLPEWRTGPLPRPAAPSAPASGS